VRNLVADARGSFKPGVLGICHEVTLLGGVLFVAIPPGKSTYRLLSKIQRSFLGCLI
jgi:hypothetical protein